MNEHYTHISLPVREGVYELFPLKKESDQDYQPEGRNGDWLDQKSDSDD
jgi:hypothetical protein